MQVTDVKFKPNYLAKRGLIRHPAQGLTQPSPLTYGIRAGFV